MMSARPAITPKKRNSMPSVVAMFSGSVKKGLMAGSVALKKGSESAFPKMIKATPRDIFQAKRRMVLS